MPDYIGANLRLMLAMAGLLVFAYVLIWYAILFFAPRIKNWLERRERRRKDRS